MKEFERFVLFERKPPVNSTFDISVVLIIYFGLVISGKDIDPISESKLIFMFK